MTPPMTPPEQDSPPSLYGKWGHPPENLDRLATLSIEQLWQVANALTEIDWLFDKIDLLPIADHLTFNFVLESVADLLDDRGELPDLLGLDDGDDLDPLWGNWKPADDSNAASKD